jgi:hypothetical protein
MTVLLARVRDARSAIDRALEELGDQPPSDVAIALIEAQGRIKTAERHLAHEVEWKPRIEAAKAKRGA